MRTEKEKLEFKKTKDFARTLRKNSTEAERKIWYYLRHRRLNGYKFDRQHPVPPYIVDFICRERKLVIELDGGQHVENKNYDACRTAFLESAGYRVLRIWNNDVFKNISGVLTKILMELEDGFPSPGASRHPLPASGARGRSSG